MLFQTEGPEKCILNILNILDTILVSPYKKEFQLTSFVSDTNMAAMAFVI